MLRSRKDLSETLAYFGARKNKVYYGPIYLRRDSEPYITIGLSSERSDTVSIAEINLKLVQEIVSQIGVQRGSDAYILDTDGRLIAHPEISLVLRKTNLSGSAQFQEAKANPTRTNGVLVASGTRAQKVLSAYARVPSVGWLVLVDTPLEQAYAPLYGAILRTIVIIVIGLGVALAAGIALARRMVIPIKTLQEGAARIGKGDLGHRVEVTTGDELEDLADQFNHMSTELHESRERSERMSRLRRFLSPQLADVIESSGDQSLLESHRREITAVFCDLRGFTAFAESARKM